MPAPIVPKYCAACGCPLKTLVTLDTTGPTHLCTGCGMKVYADPKLAVGVILVREGRVLLIRRSQLDVAHGRWILPGGHVNRGEVVEEAARREAWEETGLRVELTGLLGVYSSLGWPWVLVVYTAASTEGVLNPGREALEAGWFGPDDLPWDGLGYESTGQALRDWLELWVRGKA